MASAFSHAVAALSIGTCFYRPRIPKRVWAAAAICSVLPDLDVIGFPLGIRYGDFWGHRGFTHSLVFAALLAGVVIFIWFRRGATSIGLLPLFTYLFLATALAVETYTCLANSAGTLLQPAGIPYSPK